MKTLEDASTYSLLAQLLERKDRIRFSICLILVVISSGLEVVSLGAVIPVIGLIVGGDSQFESSWIPESLRGVSDTRLTILLLSLLVLAFLVKNLFLLASMYFEQRSQFSLMNRIAQRLFETYLGQPYEFHLRHSSSVLMRNVEDYSGTVVYFLRPSLQLIADGLTGIGLVAVLFAVDPLSTAVIAILFGGTAFIVLRLTRDRARVWGEKRLELRENFRGALLAGFGGVKEIKLFGRDREVTELHRRSVYGSARISYLFNIAQSIPRAVLEVLAVAGVATTVLVSILRGESASDSILIIALFGVAAFRILPSMNRVVVALQQMALSRPGLEGAVHGLSLQVESSASTSDPSIGQFQELQLRDVVYQYPNTDKPVLNLQSFVVQVGDSIGVVGSSGSGKSTFIDVLIGILSPSRGRIEVNGRNIAQHRRQWQNKIGYVPQNVYLMDTTIRRNVAFGLPEKLIDNKQVERALRQANLLEFVQTLPNGWDTEVGERGVRLSGGQRQRLGIARALYGNPEVIVLDEATSALDAATEREIVESFREIAHDHTLIVVAHRTSTLKYCNRLVRLEDGKITQEGTFEEVIGSLPDASDRGQ
jgi:ABC-type multidrug transport system fused ATPase/permease subunit